MDAGDLFTVTLKGGRPWGVRLQGGYEYAQRIRVAKVGSRCIRDDDCIASAGIRSREAYPSPLPPYIVTCELK